MSLRRKPRPAKVRQVLTESAPAGIVAADYAEEIIRLRGAMKQAAELLKGESGRGVAEARLLLRDTLRYEGWWQRSKPAPE